MQTDSILISYLRLRRAVLIQGKAQGLYVQPGPLASTQSPPIQLEESCFKYKYLLASLAKGRSSACLQAWPKFPKSQGEGKPLRYPENGFAFLPSRAQSSRLYLNVHQSLPFPLRTVRATSLHYFNSQHYRALSVPVDKVPLLGEEEHCL